jgi:hypothetical protein
MADMTYRPERFNATCAWCGQQIIYVGIGNESPWATTDGDRTCYEENPHAPDFDIIVSREGAANRTADELAAVFVLDVADIRYPGYQDNHLILPAEDHEDVQFASEITGWCDDPDDSQRLSDLIPKWEAILSDAGYSVAWDDGYQIWRVAFDDEYTERGKD